MIGGSCDIWYLVHRHSPYIAHTIISLCFIYIDLTNHCPTICDATLHVHTIMSFIELQAFNRAASYTVQSPLISTAVEDSIHPDQITTRQTAIKGNRDA